MGERNKPKALNVAKLLISSSPNVNNVVPPVLKEVGKLAASVASISTAKCTASATGNPRNKCALQPGHSLMDWIRLGASGKDLTGVGELAGKLKVTPEELGKHKTEKDAWIAIRGNVYNITAYLNFHPGGVEQLMLGAGKEATELFNGVHPWVNYDQILSKCFIGRLVSPAVLTEIPDMLSPSLKKPSQPKVQIKSPTTQSLRSVKEDRVINFDWIQKADTLYLYFYTKSLQNPYLEIKKNDEKTAQIRILLGDDLFIFNVEFLKPVSWPFKFKINYETGKIEINITKLERAIWASFGNLVSSKEGYEESIEKTNVHKITYVKRVNHDCVYIEVERTDGVIHNSPVGKHVLIFNDNNDCRNYTSVPGCLKSTLVPETYNTPHYCFMIKRYPKGLLSQYISYKNVGETINISDTVFGSFNLSIISDKPYSILLAAGTGLTPMLSIILFLLERRVRPSTKILLVSYNRHEDDLIFKTPLRALAHENEKFFVEFILSKPSDVWHGLKGHINVKDLQQMFLKHFEHISLQNDASFCICGPPGFTEKAEKYLVDDFKIAQENMHVFPA